MRYTYKWWVYTMRGYNNKYSVKTHVELHIVNPYTLRLPRRYVTHS